MDVLDEDDLLAELEAELGDLDDPKMAASSQDDANEPPVAVSSFTEEEFMQLQVFQLLCISVMSI